MVISNLYVNTFLENQCFGNKSLRQTRNQTGSQSCGLTIFLFTLFPRPSTLKNWSDAEDYANDHESWITSTKELLSTLPSSHYRLLGYLAIYLSRYEARHGRSAGVCGVFAPVILPHVPPATTLLRDILAEALVLFPDWWVSTIFFLARESGKRGWKAREVGRARQVRVSKVRRKRAIRLSRSPVCLFYF